MAVIPSLRGFQPHTHRAEAFPLLRADVELAAALPGLADANGNAAQDQAHLSHIPDPPAG